MTPRLRRILFGILLTASLFFIGAVVGGVLSKIGADGMGWDQLARALGGMMIGGAAGVLAGIVLSIRLNVGALQRAAIGCVALTLLTLGGLYWRARIVGNLGPSQEAQSPDGPPKTPTAPAPLPDN